MAISDKTEVVVETGKDLSEDGWWDLVDQLRLRLQPAYEAAGGAVAFIRRERDGEDSDL